MRSTLVNRDALDWLLLERFRGKVGRCDPGFLTQIDIPQAQLPARTSVMVAFWRMLNPLREIEHHGAEHPPC